MSNQTIITDLVAYIKQNQESHEAILLSKFARVFCSHISQEDMVGRSIKDLHSAVVEHWNLCNDFRDGLEVKVFNPTLKEDGWESKSTVVMIVSIHAVFSRYC